MNKFWKRALCAVLTASFAIGALTGCGGGDKKAAGTSQPAAGQKVKINFPTASASGALALGMLWFILRENGKRGDTAAPPQVPDNLKGDV